jgi:SAM-dependent methyltransferase
MNLEQAKYEKLWREHPAYRVVAPGEGFVSMFLRNAEVKSHHTVVDFGCGTGRGARKIRQRTGARVIACDFVDQCMDSDVDGVEFHQHDLTKPLTWLENRPVDYGYCTDVMEHIPTEDVPQVLANIVSAARRVFFAISTVDDAMGALIGEPLHLTVKPADWWRELLEKHLHCRIIEETVGDTFVAFYLTAYITLADISQSTKLNVEEARIRDNIRTNLGLGLAEVVPHAAQPDLEVMLLCGGPSLNDFTDEIVADAKAGMPIITVNGTYNWAVQQGLKPGLQVIVDARQFNRRFLEPVVDSCQYAISSQCDPALVASVPAAQALLWHSGGDFCREVIEEYSKESLVTREWYPIAGGSTVTLCTLTMLAMLGFRKIHIYGFDSCLRAGQHHAYAQPENDSDPVLEISLDGRKFECASWHWKQAGEFQELVQHVLNPAGVELAVHGDGLIAAILNAASDAATEV